MKIIIFVTEKLIKNSSYAILKVFLNSFIIIIIFNGGIFIILLLV